MKRRRLQAPHRASRIVLDHTLMELIEQLAVAATAAREEVDGEGEAG